MWEKMRGKRVLKSATLAIASAFVFLISPALSAPLITAPDAPQNVQATRGNASATIRWIAPANDGGSAITSYRIQGSNGVASLQATPAATASSYTFTRLTNGLTYDFLVYAVNSAGQSENAPVVTAVPSTTTATVPAVPVIKTVDTTQSRTLRINYSLGNSNGSTITDVSYSLNAGASWESATSNPIVIADLTNGFGYAFRLRATNFFGNSTSASKTIKPVATKNYIYFTKPPAIRYLDVQTLEVTETGGTTVISSVTPAICSVTDLAATALKPGTCSLRATNSGDQIFAAATSVTKTITISKAVNAFAFTPLVNMELGAPNQQLDSSADGGTPSYVSSTTSVCTIVAGAVHPVKVGTCTVKATNTGDTYYAAATPISQSILITRASASATPSATSASSASATPTSSSTSVPTPIMCSGDAAQLCGPISNVSVSVDGANQTTVAGTVSVDVGRPVRINYMSNSTNSGKRVLITLDAMSAGVTSSVPHTDGLSPWSSSSCYPDGSNSQCQLMLDSNGSGYFIATFTGATVGSTFEIRQKGPNYSSDPITATFKSATSTPSASPTVSVTTTPSASSTASASASPTPTAAGPWTIRQSTFSTSDFVLNPGDAALWVGYGWYASGLQYGTVHLPIASSKIVSFHVTDKLGAVAANKSVTLILGKGWSNSTSHIRVGSVTTNGIDPNTGVHQGTVSALTNASGDVSFSITNLDSTNTTLYSQISAYVADVGKDVVDIINIAYDQSPAGTPTASPSTSPSASASTSPRPMPGMSLLWQDEFNGSSGAGPNSSYWNADLQDGCSSGNCGWGNGEREWYTADANKLNGSSGLVITANKLSSSTAPNCYYGKCTWSSGKLTTYGKVNFTYGYLEARIKNPAGGGTWPAFWMLGQDIATRAWPLCGEIDIMEGEGNDPYTNWGTAHWANSNPWDHIQGPGNNTVRLSSKLSDAYHTYGMLWTPTSLTWYIDGTANYTLNKSDVPNNLWPFGPTTSGGDPKFYAILNVAMGGGMGGNIDSALTTSSMTVDYLKYYSVNGQGKVTLTP